MVSSGQLLIFIFENQEAAYQFYHKCETLIPSSEDRFQMIDAVYVHRGDHTRLRLEFAVSDSESSIIRSFFRTKFVRQLQPGQSALLIYLVGDMTPLLLAISQDYDLRLLRSTIPIPQYQDPASSSTNDDLTKLVGIGPKIAAVLSDAGIDTYQKLAEVSESDLQTILRQAGTFITTDVTTWRLQAAYAVNHDWAALADFKRKRKRVLN